MNRSSHGGRRCVAWGPALTASDQRPSHAASDARFLFTPNDPHVLPVSQPGKLRCVGEVTPSALLSVQVASELRACEGPYTLQTRWVHPPGVLPGALGEVINGTCGIQGDYFSIYRVTISSFPGHVQWQAPLVDALR